MAVMRARIKSQGPQADMLRCLLCGFARCVPQLGNALALLIAVAEHGLGLGNVEGLAADSFGLQESLSAAHEFSRGVPGRKDREVPLCKCSCLCRDARTATAHRPNLQTCPLTQAD